MTDDTAGIPAVPASGAQEAYFASTRGEPAVLPPPGLKPGESVEMMYMRQTRNAVTFIAVVAGIVCALSVVAAIIMGVQLGKVNSQLSNLNGTTSSNCYSQGGTNLSC